MVTTLPAQSYLVFSSCTAPSGDPVLGEITSIPKYDSYIPSIDATVVVEYAIRFVSEHEGKEKGHNNNQKQQLMVLQVVVSR
jgi:hypothetical protein